MTKFGIAGEKHDHTPEEWGCGYYPKHPCGKQHICCVLCEKLYQCQEGRCVVAIFSMRNQPNPAEFGCIRKKTIAEITWDMLFSNGSDTY